MLITQRTNADCMLACLSMAFSYDYDEFIGQLGTELWNEVVNGRGTDSRLDVAILDKFECTKGREYWVFDVHTKDKTKVSYVDKNLLQCLITGRRAILTVPSLNYPDRLHAIYWDGFNVFDPSPDSKYTTWSDIELLEVLIFNERT